ncbi:MAG: 2-hydroxyacid dehydrogenase [Verrucomicrobia bacterium]|nr:2-hydroxyacid dehydrogenase [Verrucomicrobiota bacterium]
MKIAVFSAKAYDRRFLKSANAAHNHALTFFEPRLDGETVALASGFPAVCAFVNDRLDKDVLGALTRQGTRLIALRCAGFNNVDLAAAQQLGLTVVRVPAYSPHGVAEHTVALMLALNRHLCRAHARVRDGNFALEGLLGFEFHGKTAGIVGTGKIGAVVLHILKGLGCQLLAHDPFPNPQCEALGARYVPLPELFATSDLISLHCPLTPESRHLINARTLAQMKSGVMLINTGRGALIDTRSVIAALKSGKVGSLGLDVYEEEADLFFEDRSNRVIQDDVFTRLLTFPNVLITGHQAFFTENGLRAIAETTLGNITAFERGQPTPNEVRLERVRG